MDSDITIDTSKIKEMGAKLLPVLELKPKTNIKIAKNFCPSCAPCMKERREEDKIKSFLYA